MFRALSPDFLYLNLETILGKARSPSVVTVAGNTMLVRGKATRQSQG